MTLIVKSAETNKPAGYIVPVSMFEMALGVVVLNFKLDLMFVVHTHALRAN